MDWASPGACNPYTTNGPQAESQSKGGEHRATHMIWVTSKRGCTNQKVRVKAHANPRSPTKSELIMPCQTAVDQAGLGFNKGQFGKTARRRRVPRGVSAHKG